MLAFGLTLLVSVAAAPPPAVHAGGEKLASTYDEASCDPSDGGECADELLIDLMPAPAALLDCQSPIIAEMIGSCDLPTPTIPSLHLPTLKKGGSGTTLAIRSGSSERISIVTAATSIDGALAYARVSLAPPPFLRHDLALVSTSVQEAPRNRLDRPPRV